MISRRRFVVRVTKGWTRLIILKYLLLFKISFMQNSNYWHYYFFIFFILHIVKHFVSPSSSSSCKIFFFVLRTDHEVQKFCFTI